MQRPATPEQWIEAAGKLTADGNAASAYPLISAIENWNGAKIDELTRSFSSLPDEAKSGMATALAQYGSGVAPALHGEAIRHLIRSGAGEGNHGQSTQHASELAVQWMRKEPAADAAWVQSLPSGEARGWTQKNLARHWALYNPDAASQWVNTLHPTDAAAVRAYLKENP